MKQVLSIVLAVSLFSPALADDHNEKRHFLFVGTPNAAAWEFMIDTPGDREASVRGPIEALGGDRSMTIKALLSTTAFVFPLCAHAHDIDHGHEHVEGGYNAQAGFVSDEDPQAYLFNPRGKPEDLIAARVRFLAEAYDLARTPEQQAQSREGA